MKSQKSDKGIKVEVKLQLDNYHVTEEEVRVVESHLEEMVQALLWASETA